MSDLITNDPSYDSNDTYDIVNRPWFSEMEESDDLVVYTSPYIDAVTGKVIISIVSPVYNDDKIIGNLGIDIDLSKVDAYVSNYKIGTDGFSALVTEKGMVVVHPQKDLVLNKTLNQMDLELASLWNKIRYDSSGVFEYKRLSQEKYLAFDRLSVNGWIVACSVPKDEIQKQLQILWILSIFIMLLLALILIVLEFSISKGKEFKSLKALYTSLEEQEARIASFAYTDSLTEIPNRRSFYETLEKETSRGSSGAVFLLDIDNFKEINDTKGHVFGDEVLKALAKRLTNIKEKDLYISRFGGDEFFILLKNSPSRQKIERIAKKLLRIFKEKFVFEKEELYIKSSIGISIFPNDSNTSNELIMNADMAMYTVKETGKNHYSFFEKNMKDKIEKKATLVKKIQEALDNNGFELVYQPQVNAMEEKVSGFEALLRLSSYEYSPIEFIPVAEESGQIIEIGKWVAKEAISQIAFWKEKGYETLPVSINFSAKQLNDASYVEYLEKLLKEFDVAPSMLEIEITENVFLEKKEETINFLNKIKAMGVQLSLDDFGTGYSSLRYLSFLPIDKVKLDKSISENYLSNGQNKVVHNIIALSHSLDLKVIAEGIETQEQFHQMQQGGCDCIQGYYFSEPLSKEKLEENYFDFKKA